MVVFTVTVLEITVPSVTEALTLTTAEKSTVAPRGNDALVQVIGPFVPWAGVIQVHPAGGAPIDLNVTWAGKLSETVIFAALAGPLLVSAIVYARSLPIATGSGESVLVIERSAEPAATTLTETVEELFAVLVSGVSLLI